ADLGARAPKAGAVGESRWRAGVLRQRCRPFSAGERMVEHRRYAVRHAPSAPAEADAGASKPARCCLCLRQRQGVRHQDGPQGNCHAAARRPAVRAAGAASL
nr:hypothetical protein [Tanacetum cinerariifolium]